MLLWPPFVTDADILFCSCGFCLFFLAYSQRSQIGCIPYFHTWCDLSANVECRSKMYCMRLTENTEHKNYAKNRHLCTIAHLILAISLQLRHVSTIGKKIIKQQYLLHVFSQCGELWPTPTNGWDRFASGAPWQISTGFPSWLRYCTIVAQWRLTKLCTIFGRVLGWYTIYTFWGLLPPNGILPGAKFTFRLSLAFSYIGRHSSSVHQPNFAAWYLHATGRPSRSTLDGLTVWLNHKFVICRYPCI